jgi:small-conductance mechanosensitive channel
MLLQTDVLRTVFAELTGDLVTAAPTVIAGAVFLVVAAVLIKLVMVLVRTVLGRVFPEEEVYRQFVATLVLVFLGFGVGLTFLSVVGLTAIAAALGTATGFVALGVSYALSGMIADAVAGVYLLRDPDFMPGDTVEVGGVVGEVESIELRKTRLDVDGDTTVRANAEIEKKWTRLAPADADGDAGSDVGVGADTGSSG